MPDISKENGRLKKELAQTHAATATVRDLWFEECDSDWEKYQAELDRKAQEIQKLLDKNREFLKASDGRIAATSISKETVRRTRTIHVINGPVI